MVILPMRMKDDFAFGVPAYLAVVGSIYSSMCLRG